jgi:hypothetical protein
MPSEMEVQMRSIVASITVVMLAGIGCGFTVGSATALPKIEAAKVDSVLAKDVGWRRDARRGQVVGPRERYHRRDATVAPESAAPRVAVLGPGSCGEFKYWDGSTCIDTRYMKRHFE